MSLAYVCVLNFSTPAQHCKPKQECQFLRQFMDSIGLLGDFFKEMLNADTLMLHLTQLYYTDN